MVARDMRGARQGCGSAVGDWGCASVAIRELTLSLALTANLAFLQSRVVGEQEVPAALLQRGDVLKVLPGARLPADGEVTAGRSHVDESMITGKALEVGVLCFLHAWASIPMQLKNAPQL